MKNAAATETLRAMYGLARRGAPLDVVAFVEALLAAAAEGVELHTVLPAFEKLGYWTRLRSLGMSAGAGRRCQAAAAFYGWHGAIRVASALGLSDVWAAAMTAHYGPTGTHASRLGADGVPTAETLAEFPQIGERMAQAAERFENLASWYDRVQADRSYADQVVEFRAPAAVAA